MVQKVKIMRDKQLSFDLSYKPLDVRHKREPVTRQVDFVWVEGERFEFWDLIDTLEAVESDEVQITNHRMGEHLKQIGVLKGLGSRRGGYGASAGPKFKQLMKQLCRLRRKLI